MNDHIGVSNKMMPTDDEIASVWYETEREYGDVSTERLMALVIDRIAAAYGVELDNGEVCDALQRHVEGELKADPRRQR